MNSRSPTSRYRLRAAIASLFLFVPGLLHSQEVLSDDGFASIPWYSSAEEVEAVWGEPLKTEEVNVFGMKMFVYHGLPTDYPETYTIFGVDSEAGLVVGNIVAFAKDSLSAAASMSDWTAGVSAVRGDPVCRSDKSSAELSVALEARWCGVENPVCSCSEATFAIFALFSGNVGVGWLWLVSPSRVFAGLSDESGWSFGTAMSGIIRGLMQIRQ